MKGGLYSMAYAPRKRSFKIRWKIAVPLFLLVCLIVYAAIGILLPKPKEIEHKFTVCGLNKEKTVEKLNKKIAETYTVSDYLYYGESLGIYETTYNAKGKDMLSGKTVELYNICNGQTTTMTMDNTPDQKITLEDLSPGFYEVIIVDNLVKKRIVFKDEVKAQPFYTAQRKGSVNKVTLIAKKDLLKDYGIVWDKNYMFLDIEKTNPQKDDIDVYIDPYGMNVDNQTVPDEGMKANGLVENKEMYDAAVMMKEELEKTYGLRVEISKSNANETAKYIYGDDGRLAIGYKKHAKYYLYLRFNAVADTNIKGVEIWHSAYTSSTLANKIMYDLNKNLGMKGSPYTSEKTMGIRKSPLTDNGYDLYANLRESGGRATMAGKGTPNSIKYNKSFVNANGMNALEIDFAYISNKDDAQYWKMNKTKIVQETAKAFAKAIKASK